MGLTKQYLAYRPVDSFNIICSARSNVNFLTYNGIDGRYALCGAAENAIVWDLRLGERVATLRRDKHEVTALRASPDRLHVALGYADGVVEIFDMSQPSSSLCSLALHRSAISILRFDQKGIRLVSGGLDTEMVVVDVVEQAGRQRLIGHNAPVTDVHFFERMGLDDIVVSASKDMQIKFWNLETQFCFKTIIDNRTEVWALAFAGELMIAGCSESTMNVYRFKRKEAGPNDATLEHAVEGLSIEDDSAISPILVTNCGTIQRAGRGRVVNLVADATERVISCHGTNEVIESFYFCDEKESKVRQAKRFQKARKAAARAKAVEGEEAPAESASLSNEAMSLSDEVKRLEYIKLKQKIKSIDLVLADNNELRVLVALANNSLQLHSMQAYASKFSKEKQEEQSVKLLRNLVRLGHQSEVRTVCFSSDSQAIGSAAGDSFKLWNRDSLQCLRTTPLDYALCSCFAPGDRYVLLGLKNGHILIVNVATGVVLEDIAAHENEVWSVSLLPDLKGCVSGSSDKTVKIWNFALVDETQQNVLVGDEATIELETSRARVLSLLHQRTLQLEESVLSVNISPDMKYLAVGLLDATVKVFFLDSFKFFLSLYGHKLPVLCLDISYDSALIATGSSDRNIKIWGLDFGDCHRSLFAHDDSVMALQFIPKTHMFFSCGKDGQIKQWDGDSFEKIVTLPGHVGAAYNLAVSPNGRYLVTCGADRTLRLYERTDEPIVLQDVQEEEREEMENSQLATGEDNAVPLLPGLKMPSRKTVSAEKSAETIMECLEICKQFEESEEKLDLHPLMRAMKVDNTVDFLLEVLSRIRASDLEESLLLLPFSNVVQLLEQMPNLIEQCQHEIELICKVVIFLFKVHLKPITGAKQLKPLLQLIVRNLKHDMNQLRSVVGVNMYGLQFMQREVEQQRGVQIFSEASKQHKKREKKRREATKRLHIEMH